MAKHADTVYDELPKSVLQHKARLGLKVKSGLALDNDFVKPFLENLLPAQRIKGGEVESLQHRYQTLDVTIPKKRTKLIAGHRKNKPLTAKEKRKFKVYDLKSEHHKFETYKQLHKLWKDYFKDLITFKNLNMTNFQAAQQKLVKADFHGCYLSVIKSKCPSYVGKSGIVLQETKNTFKIIMRDDKMTCIPKMNSVFGFEVEGFIFKIYGNHFCIKASSRSVKKFKLKATLEM